MKRALSLLIALCLIMGLAVPALAVEDDTPPQGEPPAQKEEQQPQEDPQDEQPQEGEDATPVVVSSYDELVADIDAAADGDTILISQEVTIGIVTLETNKNVTLARYESYQNGALIRIGTVLYSVGLSFTDHLLNQK